MRSAFVCKLSVMIMLSCVRISAFASLFEVCIGVKNPQVDEVYETGGMPLTVLQVLHGSGGVLVHQKYRNLHLETKIVFVKMNVAGLTDDCRLPNGLYKCTGTYVYVAIGGNAKTIPAFRAMSSIEIDEYRANVQRRAEQNKLEQARRQQELEQLAVKEQPEREDFAKKLLEPLELNVMKYIRAEPKLAGRLRAEIKHFSWRTMENQKSSKAWLDLLNSMQDVIDEKDDFTHRYKQYPSKDRMQEVVSEFVQNCPLKISIEPIGEQDAQLQFVVYENNPLWFQDSAEKIRTLSKRDGKYPCIYYPMLYSGESGRYLDQNNRLSNTYKCRGLHFGVHYFVVCLPTYGKSSANAKSLPDFDYEPFGRKRKSQHTYQLFAFREFLLSAGNVSIIDGAFQEYADVFIKYRENELSAREYLDTTYKIVSSSKWEMEVERMFVGIDGDARNIPNNCSDNATKVNDMNEFGRCYAKIRPSERSKTELAKKLSVLIQAIKNEKMAAIYKRYTDKDASQLLASFESEWKGTPKDKREEVYLKYYQAYIGKVQNVASNAGCKLSDDSVENVSNRDNSAANVNGESKIQRGQVDRSVKTKCSECVGKGLIVCSECNGEGKLRAEYKAGLGGRNLSMRKSTCKACKGKGKVKCESCKGTGQMTVSRDDSAYADGFR